MNMFFTKNVNLESSKEGISATLSEYGVEDAVGDVILQGAFDQFLAEKETIPLLFGHDKTKIAGDWKNLRMEGAKLKGDLIFDNDGFYGKEAALHVEKNRISDISIGFTVRNQEDYEVKRRNDGKIGIDFKNIDIFEASLVLRGAHPSAMIDKHRAEVIKDFEEYLDKKSAEELKKSEDKAFWNEIGNSINSILLNKTKSTH